MAEQDPEHATLPSAREDAARGARGPGHAADPGAELSAGVRRHRVPAARGAAPGAHAARAAEARAGAGRAGHRVDHRHLRQRPHRRRPRPRSALRRPRRERPATRPALAARADGNLRDVALLRRGAPLRRDGHAAARGLEHADLRRHRRRPRHHGGRQPRRLRVGGKSIGLNIVLPHEQEPNPYITPELCFQFHYFALRKMHFLMRAKALVFPRRLRHAGRAVRDADA